MYVYIYIYIPGRAVSKRGVVFFFFLVGGIIPVVDNSSDAIYIASTCHALVNLSFNICIFLELLDDSSVVVVIVRKCYTTKLVL
jgi:hypothetical protein